MVCYGCKTRDFLKTCHMLTEILWLLTSSPSHCLAWLIWSVLSFFIPKS